MTYVLGAGAIGGLFAAHLAAARVPVTLLLRPERLAQWQGRIRITEGHRGGGGGVSGSRGDAQGAGTPATWEAEMAAEPLLLPARAAAPPAGARGSASSSSSSSGEPPPIRTLLVATKANDALAAVSAVAPRLGADSVVVLLQNGVLGVADELRGRLFCQPGRQQPSLVLGSTVHGAYRAPGPDSFHIVHAGRGSCLFGLAPGEDPADGGGVGDGGTAAAAAAHAGAAGSGGGAEGGQLPPVQATMALLGSLAGLQPTVNVPARELEELLLLKLVVNCCANPLSALLHCKNGGLLDNEAAAQAWRAIAAECKAALGDRLPGDGDSMFEHVSRVVGLSAHNYNSMLQDVVAGRPTEVDYLNGWVVAQGRRAGVPTPWNEALAVLVRARQGVARGMLTAEQL